MKILTLFLLFPLSLMAHLNIAVTYPYIGAITKTIGGDHLDTIVLAKGNWDPHFVIPRPSLIGKVRNADALIVNGGELEIGWLPPLIKRASNAKIAATSNGYLDLSQSIDFLEKPEKLDRSLGDVHPAGNPHFHLDPNNVLILAAKIRDFLQNLDSEHADIFAKNYQNFSGMWKTKMQEWDAKMAPKKGTKVVQFHNNLEYFNHAYSLTTIATIEPLPGIPPSSKHTIKVIRIIDEQQPCCILHDVYHSTKTAEFIHKKTGIPIVLMPHDIGALDEIEDLAGLFDYLTDAIQ
jgi:zinc/manganese transport system substrate-binding protein